MADEQNWDEYTNQAYLTGTNTILASPAAGVGVEIAGAHIVARRVAGGPFVAEGLLAGGLGGSGGLNASADWNGADMARAGAGIGVYRGNNANGPDTSNGYYYSLGFEQNPTLGTGYLTQMAIPANYTARGFAWRAKVGGAWGNWQAILTENASGQFLPRVDNVHSLGAGSARFSVVFAGTGAINTSDERQKADIGPIPDDWLDAWGDVAWCRFRFNGGKRWHTGLIAQRVYAAFKARGLDAFDIGLCCFDSWDEERATVLDDDGNVTGEGKVTRAAGDLWGLRYDECFAMEAAWVRREFLRLERVE